MSSGSRRPRKGGTTASSEGTPAAVAVGVGSTIWFFDVNRRVYEPAPPGRIYPSGGPIWREHWVKRYIVGATRVSWLVGVTPTMDPRYAVKCPKSEIARRYALSEQDIAERAYAKEHGHRIADRVRTLDDAGTLRQIAALVGYTKGDR